jgi:hypothetical protein
VFASFRKVKIYRIKNNPALRSVQPHVRNVFVRKMAPAQDYDIELRAV